MAQSTENTQKTERKFDIPEKYQYQYRRDYESDWSTHQNYIQSFDEYEAMLMGTVYDSVSNSVGGKITDSYSTTLAKERADRVMAKLPQGNVIPMAKADMGKAAFFDILRQKWIYPNANAQHSFREKLNMWQFYSSVYGYMPMFYDWNVSPSGYVGPDCWLWNPRNLVPQQGRYSINDMEYVTALTWVSKTYLKDVLDDIGTNEDKSEMSDAGMEPGDDARDDEDPAQPDNEYDDDGWDVDALKLLIQIADNGSVPDFNMDTKVTRDRTPTQQRRGVLLATRYEAGEDGEWVTFAPELGFVEVRRLKNPHQNGRIPFVIKYSQPLFDSFYGLGDFQRAKPLQFARDGLTNFYFKGIKMNLIPPVVANANGVIKHTLDYREGAVMLETIPNSIRRLETSTAGLATFQAAQDALTGSLLSLFGSQNASIAAGDSNNPSQGKTPQAINLYADKEATRDGSERRHLEDAIEQLTNGFFSLVANIGTEEIPVTLLAQDIQDIVDQGYGDIREMFEKFKVNSNSSAGELKIDPKKLKGIEVRFHVDPDSTAETNQQAIMQSINNFLEAMGKIQNVLTQDPGVSVHWDLIMQEYEAVSGIPNAKKFITFDQKASEQAKMAAAQAQQQQMQNPVQLPGGQVHEMADLGKMFAATVGKPGYENVQNALLQAMGIQAQVQPTPEPAAAPPTPTVTSTGHAFNDPTVAAAAEAISQHPTPPPAEPQPAPTVTSSGHAFNDATIAQAAEAIHGMNTPAPAK